MQLYTHRLLRVRRQHVDVRLRDGRRRRRVNHGGDRGRAGAGHGDRRGAVAGHGARREEVVDAAHCVGGESGLGRGHQNETKDCPKSRYALSRYSIILPATEPRR